MPPTSNSPSNARTRSESGSVPHYSPETRRPIVVHSHLRWSFVWQRPQQTHSRLAAMRPVLFVEEPVDQIPGLRDALHLYSPLPNLWVVEPRVHPGPDSERRTLQLLREAGQGPLREAFRDAVHWLYTPSMEPQIDAFPPPSAIVYDCMDELSNFASPPPGLAEREARLLRRADIVFAGGYELGAAKSRLHENVHVFGCGVDFEHFHKAAANPEIPFDLALIPEPRLGYFGVIDERIDYDLVRDLARTDRSWSIVLIGPLAKVDPLSLPQEPNIVYMGPRDYAELPGYAAGFAACLMPFAMNDASYYINPTKSLEYLATGKPVLSTPVRDVVRQFHDVVHIADAERFPGMVRRVLAGELRGSEAGIEKARESSWEKTVALMTMYVSLAAHARAQKRTKPPAAQVPIRVPA
jgi:glycosyltransferase involved in cell wall biosynthesis